MRRFLQWFFRNRKIGTNTIAQAPNLVLWIVIASSVLIWAWRPAGNLGKAVPVVGAGWLLMMHGRAGG